MPDSAQLINYHTGLFLEVGEFILDQNYHRRLRRTVNYGLLSSGIVYGLSVEYNGAAPTVRVRKGIAVNNDPDAMIAKEIILAADYDVPLTGISSGQAYIVLSYDIRDGAVKPSSPPGQPATTIEVAKIEAVPGASFIPVPDTKIVLGRITIGTPLTTNPARQMARIRAELLPATGPAPGIVVAPPTVAAGTTAVLTVVATGSFDLTGVVAADISITGSGITGIAISGNTGTQMQLTFVVASGATAGTRTLTITKSGVVVSAPFTIAAGLTLTGYVGVDVPSSITVVRLNGTGFSAPATVEFSTGPGTFTAPVPVPAADITATEIRVAMASIPVSATKGPVRVTVPGYLPITSGFDFVPPALNVVLTQISRSPGDLLDITGSRFIAPVTVLFAPYTAGATRGPSSTPAFPSSGLGESASSTALRVSVPAGAQTGRVRIVTGATPGTPGSETVESGVSLTVS